MTHCLSMHLHFENTLCSLSLFFKRSEIYRSETLLCLCLFQAVLRAARALLVAAVCASEDERRASGGGQPEESSGGGAFREPRRKRVRHGPARHTLSKPPVLQSGGEGVFPQPRLHMCV